MIGSTVTTFGKIDNAERGRVNGHCVDLALTKYEAVILSLPSFSPKKFFKKSFQQLSTTPLGDQLHCNLHFTTSLPHYLQPTSTTSLSCLLPFLKDNFKSLQHPKKKLATKALVLLPIIVKRTNLGICKVLVFFWGGD